MLYVNLKVHVTIMGSKVIKRNVLRAEYRIPRENHVVV
jgi:hypothetical protein